jgi:hypothetical protein
MLYATTKRFLEVFGLSHLEDLPTLRELEELDAEGEHNGADAAGDLEGAGVPDIAQEVADADASLEHLEISGKPH